MGKQIVKIQNMVPPGYLFSAAAFFSLAVALSGCAFFEDLIDKLPDKPENKYSLVQLPTATRSKR
jgi:hypothetical protein